MKQPKKDDNRPKILSKDITKAQHIIPAKIIKKWKQHGVLLTRIKNNPKLQHISNERNELFCVYHRWLQGVEEQKTKIEKEFYKLIDEWEKSPSNLVIDGRDQKRQEIVLNYFKAINVCNSFKTSEGNSYEKLNLPPSVVEQSRQNESSKTKQELQELRDEFELCGVNYVGSDCKIDMSHSRFIVHQRLCECENDPRKAIWYYIKTKERLYLPDCYKPLEGMDDDAAGIVNVSPHSVLISQYFIDTLLSKMAEIHNFDLSRFKFDINNNQPTCAQVGELVEIINYIALESYDKWIIM